MLGNFHGMEINHQSFGHNLRTLFFFIVVFVIVIIVVVFICILGIVFNFLGELTLSMVFLKIAPQIVVGKSHGPRG